MDWRSSNRLLAFTRDGRSTEAIEFASAALEKDPDDFDALFCLAQTYDTIGESSEAFKYAERACEVFSSFATHYLAARCSVRAGLTGIAYKHSVEAIDSYDPEAVKMPLLGRGMLWLISWVPMFRNARGAIQQLECDLTDNLAWLKEYASWYEKNHASRQ